MKLKLFEVLRHDKEQQPQAHLATDRPLPGTPEACWYFMKHLRGAVACFSRTSCSFEQMAEPEYLEIDTRSTTNSWFGRVCDGAFLMVMIHYLLWGPMAGLALAILALSFGIYGVAFGAVCIALYIPSFLNADPFRTGRVWESFRQSSWWSAAHKYLRIKVIREAKLDPSKQYIFGLHPHGILVLSRCASYGGLFETLFPGIQWRGKCSRQQLAEPLTRHFSPWCNADVLRSGLPRNLSVDGCR